MPGSVIGIQMGLGFLGQFARNGDYVVRGDRPVQSTDAAGPTFGQPCCFNASNDTVSSVPQFIANSGTPSMSNFAGFAVREVKTMETFIQSGNSAPTVGGYAPGQACDIIKRGNVIVQFQAASSSSAQAGGAVYLRISTNGTYPSAVVGGIESAADGAHTIQLTNCQFFTGLIDSNNLVEIEMLTIANA
jgi:hypothetical protein